MPVLKLVSETPELSLAPEKLISETSELALAPEDTAALAAAFDSILLALGLARRDDPITRLVAGRILEIARSGERDPHKIKQAALASLKR